MRMAIVAVTCAAGCTSNGSGQRPPRPVTPDVIRAPVSMTRTPNWVLTACATARQLHEACPTIVPAAATQGSTFFLDLPTRRNRVSLLQIETGVEYGGFSERAHRPPIMSNVVLVGGDFLDQDNAAFPEPGAATTPVRGAARDGMRRRAIALGPRRWAGRRGQLSLTPSISPHAGELADLTVFRWADAGGDHAVGVNVWEPLWQSVATLHAIVARLRPERAPPAPRIVESVDGIRMTTTPEWMRELCSTSPLTRPACPARLPQAATGVAAASSTPTPPYGAPSTIVVSIEWFGNAPLHNAHPPRFGHVEVSEGRFPVARQFGARPPLSAMQIPVGPVAGPIPLGHRSWTEPAGFLVFGDCFGNHLCYRWRRGGHRYQVDLHAWNPLTHTVDVLHAMVDSTPSE